MLEVKGTGNRVALETGGGLVQADVIGKEQKAGLDLGSKARLCNGC